MKNFKAVRTASQVPTWDLKNEQGTIIGCLTNFEGEGPMATVRDNATEAAFQIECNRTVSAKTVEECLTKARKAYQDLLGMADLSKLTWKEMTEAQRDRYQAEYVESYVLETGESEETANLIFECRFDCAPRDEAILCRRDASK
jgi:hypothetical protein